MRMPMAPHFRRKVAPSPSSGICRTPRCSSILLKIINATALKPAGNLASIPEDVREEKRNFVFFLLNEIVARGGNTINCTMQIHLLGTAAGGGVPQWNCN